MQGQSPPVQVKDPYTGSILMHVGSSCKHIRVYNVHLPRIIRNCLMGVTGKQNKKQKHIHPYPPKTFKNDNTGSCGSATRSRSDDQKLIDSVSEDRKV